MLARLLGERIDLDIRVDGSPHIVADRGQLEQILLNLASNARDAMPEGGTVTVSALADGRGVVGLAFADTGPGMDPEIVDRVCEPFFTTKPRGQGTGLGLSTVHGIVSQNGGGLTIDSAPGHGHDDHHPLAPGGGGRGGERGVGAEAAEGSREAAGGCWWWRTTTAPAGW